jgi:hypothetical protein
LVERRFAARTVAGCERVARALFEDLERRSGTADFSVLMAADVSEFLLGESHRLNIGGMRAVLLIDDTWAAGASARSAEGRRAEGGRLGAGRRGW